MEKFVTKAEGVASGTDKTLINLFNPVATPLTRAEIYELVVGSVATPADQAAKFELVRSTAVGTEGSGFTPNNLDNDGPAGEYDSGVAHSVEPTYTSNKELLLFPLNQRATYRHICREGAEFLLPATQNNGAGFKTGSSTSTQAHDATIYFAA